MENLRMHFKNWVDRVKKVNIDTFGTDEKLDYRIVYKDRLEKAREGKEPLG
ncbi:hypothetical protein BD780_001395 [Clostridium tetanomorphum]|uniref:Uncharacterized protein n=1 Tax=Clostridium tetanomorphum TaxID=1553 RepID=A0A923E7X8_CLOTT|nr:hypothetical protein [Clostridium tetanomorphum]MBC2398130.1 hypothetical protein [Clostridium tetanomorphum]MBP1866503.1 hypothetical protein [Clostridium tetanomorphum]NRS84170.1 hypothetical protein [Clostridium tetanomorphum]NRZ97382.1 hypothetical protein [Clostridium tetanomorphum]SQB92614.1 Uncharacterised protein [Clostridium tetanomorphum]